MNEYVYCSDGTPLASAGGEISLPRERVVRCGDCKHYNEISGTYGLCQSYQWSDYAIEVYPIDYCSYGERREQ